MSIAGFAGPGTGVERAAGDFEETLCHEFDQEVDLLASDKEHLSVSGWAADLRDLRGQ
jgi:hypothetical protein